MTLLRYSRRNPRRMLPIFLCALGAFCVLVLLQTLSASLAADKKEYVAMYKRAYVLQPLLGSPASPLPPDAVAVRVTSVPVKLALGTAAAPLLDVGKDDLPLLLSILGIGEGPPESATFLSHMRVERAAKAAGSWATLVQGQPTWLFESGPACAIRVLPASPTGHSWLVPVGDHDRPAGWATMDYRSELGKVTGDVAFINAITTALVLIVFLVLLITAAGLTWAILRSRRYEIAIMQVIGYHRRALLALVSAEVGLWLAIGSLCGALAGWAGGVLVADRLTPGGIQPHWPAGTTLYALFFFGAMQVVAVSSLWRAVGSTDPVTVVEKAQEVS